MLYKYCPDENFEDLSSGRVIIHKSGFTNFPVRLAQEIFRRCLDYTDCRRLTVYDPCCGGGYLLTVLGFLNHSEISNLTGSDIDENALSLAADNLALLGSAGMNRRIERLKKLQLSHGKQNYADAIESAGRLKLIADKTDISTTIFKADALGYDYAALAFKPDIIITDVPYGKLVTWQGEGSFPDNLIPCLRPESVLAIISDKSQKLSSARFKRLEKHNIGKRKFEILKLDTDF
ncbi:MAG: hypothetical protein PHZ09_03695 [Eubacteriales bacterium]|nr:hypothetical protein [Eubacteriales bacterium]